MNHENQISKLINVAKQQITFCEEIANYPQKMGKLNYEAANPINNFYKSAHNSLFFNCVLIVGSLLNNRDKNTISFWNWTEFVNQKKEKLNNLTKKFNSDFKSIRDQVIAHQDKRNSNNKMIDWLTRDMVDKKFITLLMTLIDEIIQEFCNYATKPNRIYPDAHFSTKSIRNGIREVLENTKPVLTDAMLVY